MKRICVAYLTGATGHSVAMFLIGDGVFSGADVGGIKYDGELLERRNGSLDGVVKFSVPAGTHLITGMSAGETPQELTANITLPSNFDDGKSVVRIDTPAGAVNARFERLREVP